MAVLYPTWLYIKVCGENLKIINLFLILIKLIGTNSINFSINQYLSKIDSLLEIHAPLTKLNKNEMKFLNKPWIKQGLQNSIKKKNNIYSKFVKCKNQKLKEFYHNNYKTNRNLLPALLKRTKEKYFTQFFNENIRN